MINVSRTIGADQIVDELVIRFTHTAVVDWMLPGILPTGRRVEAAFAVIVKFEGDKIAHEHIYWDQAGVLVQLGLIDPAGLPVSGAESARKVLDPKLPSRVINFHGFTPVVLTVTGCARPGLRPGSATSHGLTPGGLLMR